MPKGYWIVHVSVNDMENYPEYVAATAPAMEKYGARFLVRGGAAEVREGQSRDRHVVIEFESYARALECYGSAEYAPALELRNKYADTDLLIVEGAE
ncbi:hypothetical protein BMS3Bbin10_00351 [bacterium BMS3Bbin10]|nr:hypothetical protein BMS3Bbin10_00351 [bacterium BMS3Bbin10]